MSSALELVKVCVDWAVAKKIYNADPVEGPWSCFSSDEMQKEFEGGHAYLGVAANIFCFDLKVWAVAGQEVALIEAQDYAGRYFKVEETVQYYSYLDAAPGSLAATAPTSNAPKFGWQVPVGVAATGITAELSTVGPSQLRGG